MCFEVYYVNSQGKKFILFPGNLSVEILGKRDSLYSQRRNISTCESNTQLAVNIFGWQSTYTLWRHRLCTVARFENFSGKTFYCQMLCDVEVTNERVHCWKKRSYVTKQFFYGVITTDKLDTYKSFESWFSSPNPCQRQFSPYIY